MESLVRPVRVGDPGGPTPQQARGPHWRRTSRGWFVPADVELTPRQRVLGASVVLPAGAAITGWAALCWRGARWSDGHGRAVPLAIGRADVRSQPGLRIVRERPGAWEHVDGVAVAVPAEAASYEARRAADLAEAVVALDMAAYSDLVSPAEVETVLAGRRGAPQARRALALADENSWSPQETRLRLVLGAGWICNAPVFDLDGRHLGTPDLIDAEAGVAVEYDGDVHLARGARHRDVRRVGRFAAAGLEVVTALAPDLHDPRALLAEVDVARARASGRTRGWTAVPPPWWTATDTVAGRRALPSGRRWLLRHRAA
ncbi:MAG: hypothetical protein CMH83_14650 [Nocardioides sp.]|nr:hypothetical protein [Nocardioides sp.]